MELNWKRENNGVYVAQGVEADSGEAVELTVENLKEGGRPWEVRAAGGLVGREITLTRGKTLAALYCTHGLNISEG